MMAFSRSRTLAVTALKLLSHDPQSRSIAALVASDVVSGPGVRRIGSREERLIEVLRRARWAQGAKSLCRSPPRLRSAQKPALGGERRHGHHRRRSDDQSRDGSRGADASSLVQLDDRDRDQRRLRRIEEYHGRDRRHRVNEIVAADIDYSWQADRYGDAPEGLVERYLERCRHRLELAVESFERGHRGEVARRV